MKKTYEWKARAGQEMKIVAEYTCEMRREELSADGHVWQGGEANE